MTDRGRISIFFKLLAWHGKMGKLFPVTENDWIAMAQNGFGKPFRDRGVDLGGKDLAPLDQAIFHVALSWQPLLTALLSLAKNDPSRPERLDQVLLAAKDNPKIWNMVRNKTVTWYETFETAENVKRALECLSSVARSVKPKGIVNRISSMMGNKSSEELIERRVEGLLREYEYFRSDFYEVAHNDMTGDDL